MAKRSKKDSSEDKVIEFVLEDLEPISSAEKTKPVEKKAVKKEVAETSSGREGKSARKIESAKKPVPDRKTPVKSRKDSRAEPEFIPRSAAARELELPKLPVFEKQNRARLQVQGPNSVYFYWSLSDNPYHALDRGFASETADYSLVLRLLDTQTEREEIHPIETEGSYWFNTDAGRTYRAEIGFYSPSRPFVRILYSNTVTTPRRSPSPRAASQAEWHLTSHKFAEVLNVTGFEQDAFDVAVTGEDVEEADKFTHAAFTELLGDTYYSYADIANEEIRLAMYAIASGWSLEKLRWKIGPQLFAILQENAERLGSEKAASALSEHLNLDPAEFEAEEYGPVFGASLVHFPRKFRTYSPLSSVTIGSS